MPFLPAIEPLQPTTAKAWIFAFAEGRLLLPEGDAPPTPSPAAPATAPCSSKR